MNYSSKWKISITRDKRTRLLRLKRLVHRIESSMHVFTCIDLQDSQRSTMTAGRGADYLCIMVVSGFLLRWAVARKERW